MTSAPGPTVVDLLAQPLLAEGSVYERLRSYPDVPCSSARPSLRSPVTLDDVSLSTARMSGPFDRDEVAAFLDGTVIPLRIACIAPSGWPLIVSLWFARRGDGLVCATQASSSLVRALEREPRCAFEVAGQEPPYRGVRGRAHVTIEPDEGLATLSELVTRYLGGTDGAFARRLLGRTAPEVVLGLDPTEVSSWDYARRMTS